MRHRSWSVMIVLSLAGAVTGPAAWAQYGARDSDVPKTPFAFFTRATEGRPASFARSIGYRRGDPRRTATDQLRVAAFWKINTHLFAANIALEDARGDGMVTIPPFGEFPVAATALSALRAAPASYRAGVLAPDLFPDMYVGGWSIHSDLSQSEGWITDDWMRHVWSRARSWPDQRERDRVMAFAYGFLTHAAGDMFAHTYVSRKADGAWVSGPEFPKPHSTAIKHVVLEGYVGSRTPPTDMTMDVWPRFVAEVLIKDPAARRRMFGAVHYRTWMDIYNWLGPQIERARRQMNDNIRDDAPYWAKCTMNPVACAKKEQMEAWRLDIDRGLRALVDSGQTLGERMMEHNMAEGVGAMTGWATEWVPKMFGAHAIGEGAAAMQEFTAWATEDIAALSEDIRAEVMRFFERVFPYYYRLYEAVQNPGYYIENCPAQIERQIRDACFPPGTKAAVDQDMHVDGGSDEHLNWREFEPLYNSVILSKLALLDGDGLNQLVRRAGVNAQLFRPGEQTNIILGVVRSMTQSYQWVGDNVNSQDVTPPWGPPDTIGPTKHGICGPEHVPMVPHQALCGIRQRNYALSPMQAAATSVVGREPVGGFALWGHPEAREKIFRVIFKGYGPGPGPTLATEVSPVIRPAAADVRQVSRTLGAVTEHIERMREIVALIRPKIAGVEPPSAQTPEAVATPPPRAAPAPQVPTVIGRGRRPPTQPPAPTTPPVKPEPPAAAVAARVEIVTSWGERCCSKEIIELRSTLSLIETSSARVRNTAALRQLGRPRARTLPARSASLRTAIDIFANARDAESATIGLTKISREIEALADATL